MKNNVSLIFFLILLVVGLVYLYPSLFSFLNFQESYGIHNVGGQDFEIVYVPGRIEHVNRLTPCIYTPTFNIDTYGWAVFDLSGRACQGGDGNGLRVIGGESVGMKWSEYETVSVVYQLTGSMNIGPFQNPGINVNAELGVKDKKLVYSKTSYPAYSGSVPIDRTAGLKLVNTHVNNVWNVYELGIAEFPMGTVTLVDGDVLYFKVSGTSPAAGSWVNSLSLIMKTSFIGEKSAICSAGQTQSCIVSGCAGTQTCAANAWGTCVKTDSSCGGGCTPSWSFGSWSDCVSGVQSRTVTDANSCGVLTGKPATSQTCAELSCDAGSGLTKVLFSQNVGFDCGIRMWHLFMIAFVILLLLTRRK